MKIYSLVFPKTLVLNLILTIENAFFEIVVHRQAELDPLPLCVAYKIKRQRKNTLGKLAWCIHLVFIDGDILNLESLNSLWKYFG